MRLTAILNLVLFTVATAAPTAAAAPLTPDSDLDTVLDALHARGQDLKDFTADVALHTIDDRTGQDTAQLGQVVYQNQGNGDSRIKVSFDTKKLETGATQKQRLDFLLEKGWLTDRDYQKKLEVRRQVLKPGQKMDLLKLGEGPFPLPIGQDKAEVKKQFKAEKIAPSKDDPKGTTHVRLTPNANTPLAKRFQQIDVYVDTKTNMPSRIDTIEKGGTSRSTELNNLKINAGVNDRQFDLPPLSDGAGWNRREEAFE
jgi:outer membrane lipoprotein-sorting protein